MRFLLAFCLVVAGCTSVRPASDDAVTVSGTVTYLPRIALPPDAVLTVRVLDVSGPDATPVMLAEQITPTEGRQVPLPFSLSVDASRLDASRTYIVTAEIRDRAGSLQWAYDTAIPVLVDSQPSRDVEIRLVQSQAYVPDAASGTDGLIGVEWRLSQIVTPDSSVSLPIVLTGGGERLTLTFGADGRYSGQADCNAFNGSYTLDDQGGLTLSPGATTLAACPPSSRGPAFLDALAEVERVGVMGDEMALRGPDRALVFIPATTMGRAPQRRDGP